MQSVNDFELGESVYFTRSVDLGLNQNHTWRVAKKGGTLLTLTTDRGSIVGGGTNLTNSDLVQISRADELLKINEYSHWEEQRAGALLAQQQQQQYQNATSQLIQNPPMNQNGGTPQINIKFVGGNDLSKGGNNDPHMNEPSVSMTGGSGFDNLVIPSAMGKKGGDGADTKTPSDKNDKTILGGLADFGNLVINKIM